MSAGAATIEAGGREVEISSPDRVLFPEAGITKLGLARYYVAVADAILPHLRDRPVHLRRYHDGIEGEGYVQKAVEEHWPEWVERTTLSKREGGEITQPVIADAASLAYLVGQGAITLHGWLARCDRPERPDMLIVDLDPVGEDFGEVREAARIAREAFEQVGLPPYLKLSGSRGVHLVAPLDRSARFGTAREASEGLARLIASREPELLTTAKRKQRRGGRLFVDALRNAYAQTAVVPYSVRARSGAPVSVPIEWSELSSTGPRDWTIDRVRRRLAQRRDPWRDFRRHARSLRGPKEKLERLLEDMDVA